MNLVRKLLLFLVIYIPLEQFALKWLPVSISVYNYLLYLTDVVLLFSLIIYVAKKKFILPVKTENIYFFLFFLLSLISVLYHQSWIHYLFKIWVLSRYILMFFIVREVFRSEDFLKFQYYFILIFIFQSVVGFIQIIELPLLYDFFLPRSDLSKGANWLVKDESGLAGTLTFTVHYGYLMFLFCLFFSLSNYKINRKLVLMFLSLILCLLSESRMAFILTFLFFFRFLYFLNRKTFFKIFLAICIIPSLFLYDFLLNNFIQLTSIFNLFSYDFIYESLMFSRLGIFKLIPLFFDNDLFTILFGFSLDGLALTDFINQSMGSDIPHVLINNPVIGIEDVYWVAHLYYFGIFGVAFYLMIFIHIIRSFKKINFSNTHIKSINVFIYLTLISAFVNQIFSFKPFMFYLVIVIAYLLKTEGNKIILNTSNF